jgi:hypothetical protein
MSDLLINVVLFLREDMEDWIKTELVKNAAISSKRRSATRIVTYSRTIRVIGPGEQPAVSKTEKVGRSLIRLSIRPVKIMTATLGFIDVGFEWECQLSTGCSIQRSIEPLVKQLVRRAVEEGLAENPVESPFKNPVESPLKNPVENSVENSVENPVENPVEWTLESMDEEMRNQEEMERPKELNSKQKRNQRRLEKRKKQKEIARMQMNMTTPTECRIEQAGPHREDSMFDLEGVENPVENPVEDPVKDPIQDPVSDPVENPFDDPVEMSESSLLDEVAAQLAEKLQLDKEVDELLEKGARLHERIIVTERLLIEARQDSRSDNPFDDSVETSEASLLNQRATQTEELLQHEKEVDEVLEKRTQLDERMIVTEGLLIKARQDSRSEKARLYL